MNKENYELLQVSVDATDEEIREAYERLKKKYNEEIGFLFNTLFYDLRESLSKIKFYFNRDLTDNVILRGLPLETERVMKGLPPRKMSVKV